ncbi:MAG: monovalent cation/H(+) antiporter subunit G [Gammaproteobacteria bacterium]|jgi:multicomponent Na+:H+ antiporter subunit G
MLSSAGWVLCATGIAVILIAAIGLVRLPDALSRQHAATKAGTVAVILFAAGAAMIAQDSAWSWRLLLIVVLLLLTLPLASHALSRAAAREMSGTDA